MANLRSHLRVHNLANGHKRSPNNPGRHDPEILEDRLAYRTARCGAVHYCRRGPDGKWAWQDGTTIFSADDFSDVTCLKCRAFMGEF